jgi:hypothetical protein
MINKKVLCLVKSHSGYHNVYGKIIRQCDNKNVYVLQLEQTIDLYSNGKTYHYPENATMLVLESEIVG